MENGEGTSSNEISVDMNKLVQRLRKKTQMLESLSSNCCIYRVSPRSRELNKTAFTPEVVSIGPYHHGKEELRAMEEHKIRYLLDFLQRCGISLEEYIENIHKLEIPLRQSYAQVTQHTNEEFMEIMAVDGAFLLEYFLKQSFLDWSSSDPIWGKQRLVLDARFDILMIENQLPFFLLESLFELLKKPDSDDEFSLIKIVAEGLMDAAGWDWLVVDNIVNGHRGVKHLIDFLGICLQPSKALGVQRRCESLATPTISELHRAGVKFKPISSKCLYELTFNNGILEIPILQLRDRDPIIFSNLQVFEQCHCSYNYMNDYTCIMDMLIDSEEDVDLLVRNGCIENWLQDNRAAAAMVNDLGKNFFVTTSNFYYAGLIQDLNHYCKTPWHKWKATLKHKYFSNPWTIISVIAAAILLLVTVIQTLFSAIQLV